jgi:hypothetical protein
MSSASCYSQDSQGDSYVLDPYYESSEDDYKSDDELIAEIQTMLASTDSVDSTTSVPSKSRVGQFFKSISGRRSEVEVATSRAEIVMGCWAVDCGMPWCNHGRA